MPKVIVAEGCQQLDSPSGRRYFARGASAFQGTVKGGVFEMTEADARLAVRMGGTIAGEAGTAKRSVGFRCGACGFGTFVKTCSRCGGECSRELLRGRGARGGGPGGGCLA